MRRRLPERAREQRRKVAHVDEVLVLEVHEELRAREPGPRERRVRPVVLLVHHREQPLARGRVRFDPFMVTNPDARVTFPASCEPSKYMHVVMRVAMKTMMAMAMRERYDAEARELARGPACVDLLRVRERCLRRAAFGSAVRSPWRSVANASRVENQTAIAELVPQKAARKRIPAGFSHEIAGTSGRRPTSEIRVRRRGVVHAGEEDLDDAELV